ncbi:MAG: hypothetical protein AB8H47_20410 [Bacteroidia bacterium]
MLKSFKVVVQSFGPIVLLAFISLSLMAMGQIKSNLTIPAKQAFELGGGNQGKYKVKAENRGVQTVKIFTVGPDEEMVAQGEVKPGETQIFKIPGQTTTVLVNESLLPARIRATITGDTNLGMGYVKVKEMKK